MNFKGEDVLERLTEDSPTQHILVRFLLAAFIPYMVERVRHLTEVLWPNWLYWLITHTLLRREIAVVEDFQKPNSTALCTTVKNEKLVDAISLYCAHLHEKAIESRVEAAAAKKQQSGGGNELETIQTSSGARTPFFANAVVNRANFRYAPRMLQEESNENHHKRLSQASAGTVIADLLRRQYALFVIPAGSSSMEVEPGLHVWFDNQEAAAETEKSEKTVDPEQNDFWMSDMMGALRKDSVAKIKGPFDRDASSDEECDEESSDEDSDTESVESEAKPVRRVFVRCCEVTGSRKDEVRKWFETEKQRELHQQELEVTQRDGKPNKANISNSNASWMTGDIMDSKNRIDFFIYRAQRWFNRQMTEDENIGNNTRYVIYSATTELQAAVEIAEGEPLDSSSSDSSGDWYSDYTDSTEINGTVQSIRRYAIDEEETSFTPSPLSVLQSTTSSVYMNCGAFSPLFFPQRYELFQLVQNFQNKTGVYAKPGFRHRLHVLISSEATGAGTTSVIKAIAKQLRRSIVVVSLRSIMTNTYFRNWFTPMKAKCKGECRHVFYDEDDEDYEEVVRKAVMTTLRPDEVVYVVEDIDRIGSDELAEISKSLVEELRLKAEQDDLLEESKKKKMPGDADDTESESELDSEESEEASTEADSEDSDNEEDEARKEKERQKKQERRENLLKELCTKFSKNRLTVEGVIEALHPKFAAPQRRVIVLTTSQPQSLDARWGTPFLLNTHIRLGPMTAEDAVGMIKFHGFRLTPQDEASIANIVNSLPSEEGLLPPLLKEYCGSSESVQELIAQLSGLNPCTCF